MWKIHPIQDSWFHTRKTVWESKTFSIQRNIGDFHQDFYIQQIKKLAYHRSYYKIIGRNHVSDVRHKEFEFTPINISTWSDYAKRFRFEPDCQLQNELFDHNCTLSMEGFCLDCFMETVNVINFYDNGGDYVHQSNDMVREFHLHLSGSKLKMPLRIQLISIHCLIGFLREKNNKRWNNVVSNRWMRKAVYVLHCLISDVFSIKIISNCSW